MSASLAIDDIHLPHQVIVRQIRVSLRHPRVVQREKRQPSSAAIQPPQVLHLAHAKATITVVNDDISFRSLVRIAKARIRKSLGGGGWGGHEENDEPRWMNDRLRWAIGYNSLARGPEGRVSTRSSRPRACQARGLVQPPASHDPVPEILR